MSDNNVRRDATAPQYQSDQNDYAIPSLDYMNSRAGNGDVATMDDFQFNASLDALLDDENLMGSVQAQAPRYNNAGSTAGTMNSQESPSRTQPQAPAAPPTQTASQGLLAGPAPIAAAPSVAAAYPTYYNAMPYSGIHQQPSFMTGQIPGNSTTNNLAPIPGMLPNPTSHNAMMPQMNVAFPSAGRPTNNSSVASTSKESSKSEPKSTVARKRLRDITEVSEDEDEREKRRQDRNMREQQRSHKITEQIAALRDVLSEANIQFKQDKYSTLVTVAEYIKQMQAKSAMLDAEHKKLIETISKTNEIVSSQYTNVASASASSAVTVSSASQNDSSQGDTDSMIFVQGIDFRNIFSLCGVALAVASIDGRFIDCNQEFERLTNFNRTELLPCEKDIVVGPRADGVPSASSVATKATGATASSSDTTVASLKSDCNDAKRNLSLFNVLHRDNMETVFVAMSEMLKHPAVAGSCSAENKLVKNKDFWSGEVRLSRSPDTRVQMNVTVIRSPQGRPKFFDCALALLSSATVG